MYSLSKGKVAIPVVWDAKKATITEGTLVAQKTNFESLYQKLEPKKATIYIMYIYFVIP